MNLGRLIDALEAAPQDRLLARGLDAPHSWRGSYDRVAFCPTGPMYVSEVLAAAKSALGATYEGWKGGSYTMTSETQVHVNHPGECDVNFEDALTGPWLQAMIAAEHENPYAHLAERAIRYQDERLNLILFLVTLNGSHVLTWSHDREEAKRVASEWLGHPHFDLDRLVVTPLTARGDRIRLNLTLAI